MTYIDNIWIDKFLSTNVTKQKENKNYLIYFLYIYSVSNFCNYELRKLYYFFTVNSYLLIFFHHFEDKISTFQYFLFYKDRSLYLLCSFNDVSRRKLLS